MKVVRRRHSLAVATVLSVSFMQPAAASILIVSPGTATSTEGNVNNAFPFNLSPLGLASERYQQVYAATDFAILGGPAVITQILFRPDAFTGSAFSSTLPNVQIDLSTTTVAPDAMSLVFADNVGPNDTVVFFGSLPLSSVSISALPLNITRPRPVKNAWRTPSYP